jgi:hypothetical protein
MSNRLIVAAIVGVCGGVAALIGTLLPWVSITVSGGSDPSFPGGGFPDQIETLNGMLASNGFVLPLTVVLIVAGGWFWAGAEPRKPVVACATGFAVAVVSAWVAISKDDAMGLGSFGQSTAVEYGVYVTVAGALVGLLAGVLAALPERDPTEDAPAAVATTA